MFHIYVQQTPPPPLGMHSRHLPPKPGATFPVRRVSRRSTALGARLWHLGLEWAFGHRRISCEYEMIGIGVARFHRSDSLPFPAQRSCCSRTLVSFFQAFRRFLFAQTLLFSRFLEPCQLGSSGTCSMLMGEYLTIPALHPIRPVRGLVRPSIHTFGPVDSV